LRSAKRSVGIRDHDREFLAHNLRTQIMRPTLKLRTKASLPEGGVSDLTREGRAAPASLPEGGVSDPLTGTPLRGEGYGQETREGNLQKSERLPVRDAKASLPEGGVSDPLTGTPLRGESGPKDFKYPYRIFKTSTLSNKFIYKFIRETRRFSPLRGGKLRLFI
jgi:hypothetical protein